MSRAGHELLARWREAGEWWLAKPQLEFKRIVDDAGKLRQLSSELPTLGRLTTRAQAPEEDHTEECGYDRRSRYGDLKIGDEFYESYKAREVRRDGAAYLGRSSSRHEGASPKPASFPFAPLHLQSGYAFGRSTLLAAEMPHVCAERGFPAAAIADPFSLVGAIEFARSAKQVGIKPLIGATFEMDEGGELVLIARSKAGYRSLSMLVSECHLSQPRRYPLCNWELLFRHSEGLLCLTGGDDGPINRLLTHREDEAARQRVERLIELYGSTNVFVEIDRAFLPWEVSVNRRLLDLAEAFHLTAVAGGTVGMRSKFEYPAQDVLTCIETLCQVEEIVGRKPPRDPTQPQLLPRPARRLNAERYLRDASEMAALYQDQPELLINTLKVVERCDDDVLPGRTRLPSLTENDVEALRIAAFNGAAFYHRSISVPLKKRIEFELDRIARLGYSTHFLVAHEACDWSRDQGILCSGRGSVVDSAVAYCLGMSRIDAFKHGLHFDRFLPEDGSKRPDIDIDFEAHRRDDVRDHLAKQYGQNNVATVCAIGTYGTRGIVREVGKVFGLPDEAISFLAKRLHGGVTPEGLEAALERRPELRNSGIPREKFEWVFELANVMADLPRNLRSHSSGVVISDRPLAETVPVMWSAAESELGSIPIIQWDKRSAKHFFDKFDILCLRGQDVLSGAQERIAITTEGFDVQRIALDDEETYRTMRSGQLVGIPQSASPAMRQAHVRLRTSDLHDASLVQAGIRPGVGGAVKLNELIARRRGLKPLPFEHPLLEKILGKSYGIIVFQEQVDELLQAFCGYTSGEAETIREAIHERRKEDFGSTLEDQLIARALARGFTRPLARHVFELVAGFKGYGFAQGHALAFAEISVRSIYCQQNHPAEYFASLLDAQPAGYYGPSTLVNEARTRGVAILPPCVNLSTERFEVEDVRSKTDPKLVFPSGGIRIALKQIAGLSKKTRCRICEERQCSGHYTSLFDFVCRIKPERDELERLILCGTLDALHPNRREMLWAIPSAFAYRDSTLSTDCLPIVLPEPPMPSGIEDFTEREKAVYERSILELDVEEHLLAFERDRVVARGGITSAEASRLSSGELAFVVGNPIRLRFPPTASGKRVVFFDLEDESGLLNVTCFDDVYQRDGHAIVCNPYVTVRGEAQDRDGHTAFLAHRVFPYRPGLAAGRASPLPLVTADFLAK